MVKQHIKQTYEEVHSFVVKHKKTTEEQNEQLMVNDPEVFDGTEKYVKMSQNNDANGGIVIDLLAHFVKRDEQEQDRTRQMLAMQPLKVPSRIRAFIIRRRRANS